MTNMTLTIVSVNKYGELEFYTDFTELTEQGYNLNKIHKCCKKHGKRYKGLKWYYLHSMSTLLR